MIIDKVTISGADDKVKHADLLKLQEDFPFVEWGILVSRKREGTARYPTRAWRKMIDHSLNISYHLCGDICREFVYGNHNVVWEAGIYWKRVQLNFKFDDMKLLENLGRISEAASHHPYKAFILPYNKTNKEVLDKFIKNTPATLPSNIHFLHDSSGGRGIKISSIGASLVNYTGHAGGIGPSNIAQIYGAITRTTPLTDKVWIDMETGVRTNDEFDIAKVRNALALCKAFAKQ